MAGQETEYGASEVNAARSVIIELIHILGEYREHLVLVGGWIPGLLIEDAPEKHIGSADVDLALNHKSLQEAGYETIERLLVDHGYRKVEGVPFQYHRTVGGMTVQVDLLAGEYGGTGERRRHQRVQDVMPRKARGCDLAFEIGCQQVEMSGPLPDGAYDSVLVPITSVVPFIVMKSIALNSRLKPRDAYDLWYCFRYYPGGVDALVEAFEPHKHHGLVSEAFGYLNQHFGNIEGIGPRYAATFIDSLSSDEQELRQRDAYERVNYVLGALQSD
jgi:hypothetical protein